MIVPLFSSNRFAASSSLTACYGARENSAHGRDGGVLSAFAEKGPFIAPICSNVVLQSHVRASSTSLVAVCDVIRDAGTFDFDFACHLILDERDRLVERRPARMGVTHLDVLEPDRHATEKDEPVRG